jgi:hypothetical protein
MAGTTVGMLLWLLLGCELIDRRDETRKIRSLDTRDSSIGISIGIRIVHRQKRS